MVFKRFGKFLLPIRIIAILTAAALVLTCTGCGGSGFIVRSSSSGSIFRPEITDESLHISNKGRMIVPVAVSGFSELYFDKLTMTAAIYETTRGKFWYSLPLSAGASDDTSCAASLEIVCGSDTYYLNTQDNSIAYGCAQFSYIKDGGNTTGVMVKYVIAPDKATALKTDYDKTDIVFGLSISYTLVDGNLTVTASTENLSENSNAKIRYLNLLEYFGASANASSGDYILVPDGCGALLYTDNNSDCEPLSFTVYGDTDSDSYSCVAAACGMKQGESAFAAVAGDGDAVAQVFACKKSASCAFNRTGFKFNLTPVKDTEKKRYIGEKSYAGNCTVCYKFLSGSGASYSGMAAACREQLIRFGTLSTRQVDSSDSLPLNLTTVGMSKDSFYGLKYLAEVTSFEGAEDMLSALKAKGINKINLRFNGALRGGLYNQHSGSAAPLSRIGGKSGLSQLYDYTVANGFSLYLGVDIFTRTSSVFHSGAVGVNGKSLKTTIENELFTLMGDEKITLGVERASKLERNVSSLLGFSQKLSFAGFCINDAGRFLYDDFSSGNSSGRSGLAYELSEYSSALSTDRNLMVDTGNFYALKSADVITNLPSSAQAEVIPGIYEAVPFIQMILHSSFDYSCENIDFKSSRTSILKCIEYGSVPACELIYKDLNGEEPDTAYYDNVLSDAADAYSEINTAVGNLRATRITGHSKVGENIYCTQYGGSTLIYVNYNEKAVTVNGITIDAQSYLRIN